MDATVQGGGQRKHGTKEAAPTTASGSASLPVATASGVTDATKNGSLISGAAASVNGAEEKAVAAPTEPVRELTIAGLQAALQEREVAEAALQAKLQEERSRIAALEAQLAAAERKLGAPSSEVVPALAISAAETSAANQKAAGRPCCSV